MCIRDRLEVEEQRRALVFEQHALERQLQFGRRAVGRVIEPVSYTHLRAHETVLDIVCRLLLEKKKYAPEMHELHRKSTTRYELV